MSQGQTETSEGKEDTQDFALAGKQNGSSAGPTDPSQCLGFRLGSQGHHVKSRGWESLEELSDALGTSNTMTKARRMARRVQYVGE